MWKKREDRGKVKKNDKLVRKKEGKKERKRAVFEQILFLFTKENFSC